VSVKRISCPKVNLAITDLNTLPFCTVKTGQSAQGILWSSDNPQEIDIDASSTSEIEKLLYPTHLPRHKRSNDKLPRPRPKLDNQIDAEFQYLYETLKDNLTFGIQIVHREVSHQLVI